MSAPFLLYALTATFASFTLSASAGLGGSLILVPALALVLGPKEAIALAALLLGANNVVKVVAYRRTLPWRAAALVLVTLTAGAAVGAGAMLHVPAAVVGWAIVASFGLTLAAERRDWAVARRAAAPALALAAGATSGFSGTSGPLKGAAIRALGLDRRHLVGAASLASLAGDLTKTAVFAEASLLGRDAAALLVLAVPSMLVGTAAGRRLNSRVGERGFAVLFWAVMVGYSVRIVAVLV